MIVEFNTFEIDTDFWYIEVDNSLIYRSSNEDKLVLFVDDSFGKLDYDNQETDSDGAYATVKGTLLLEYQSYGVESVEQALAVWFYLKCGRIYNAYIGEKPKMMHGFTHIAVIQDTHLI